MARGWFGAADARCCRGSATSSSACRGTHGVFSSVDFAYETRLLGLHGSLTPDEMHIPILVC